MQYKYMALAPDNAVVRGKVESSDEQLVDAWLADAGYKVVSIQAVSGRSLLPGFSLFSAKVKPKELVLFFQQLAALIKVLLSFPDVKLFWQHEKDWVYTREFVAYVTSLEDDA